MSLPIFADSGAYLFTVTCPSGKRAISGGWNNVNPAGEYDAPSLSEPVSDGSGWQFEFDYNVAVDGYPSYVYAVCVDSQ